MIELSEKGLYCAPGGFYIDPCRRVDIALVTHAHSDHARKGMKHYYCAASGKGLLAKRVGENARITPVQFHEELRFGGVKVSFHPAGHILGSAQIRVEYEGEVWVASGDYKRDADPTCEPFEPVPCDVFLTEATFGSPRYRWTQTSADTAKEILEWWETNRNSGRNCVLFAYALGKTQRILGELKALTNRRVLVYGEGHSMNECYRAEGIALADTALLEEVGHLQFSGELVIAPHSLAYSSWMDKLGDHETAFASGWMSTGAFGMGARYDRGFVMSDHADFPALVQTAQETRAKQIKVLHAREGMGLVKHLRALGIDASPMSPLNEKGKRLARNTSRETEPAQAELFPKA